MDESSSHRTATTARMSMGNDDTTTTGYNHADDDEVNVVEVVYNSQSQHAQQRQHKSTNENGARGSSSLLPPMVSDDVVVSSTSASLLKKKNEHTVEEKKDDAGDAAAKMGAPHLDSSNRSSGPVDLDDDPDANDDSENNNNNNNNHQSSSDDDDDEEEANSKPSKQPPYRSNGSCLRTLAAMLNDFRLFCGRVVNHERVQLVIVLLIIANALLMGVATFDFVTENEHVARAFEITDRAFLIVFTVESALQLFYYGWYLFQDAWLVFDLAIVLLSWSLESLQVIRAFRVFRALRLVTRLSVLKNLLLAIFAVAPSITSITALLVLILYIYAVLCTELFGALYAEGVLSEDYFGRLENSLFTLFQMMTLEDWAAIVREVMEKHYWSWVVFCTYLVFTGFILYSLIIAVVCDAVSVTEHEADEELEAAQKTQSLQRVVHLQKRVQLLTAQQQQATASIQAALEELRQNGNSGRDDDNEDEGSIELDESDRKLKSVDADKHASSYSTEPLTYDALPSSSSLPSLHLLDSFTFKEQEDNDERTTSDPRGNAKDNIAASASWPSTTASSPKRDDESGADAIHMAQLHRDDSANMRFR